MVQEDSLPTIKLREVPNEPEGLALLQHIPTGVPRRGRCAALEECLEARRRGDAARSITSCVRICVDPLPWKAQDGSSTRRRRARFYHPECFEHLDGDGTFEMEMYVAAYEEAEEEAWRADPSRPSPREAWRRADHGRCVLEGGGSTVPAPAGPGKQLCFIHNFAPQVRARLGSCWRIPMPTGSKTKPGEKNAACCATFLRQMGRKGTSKWRRSLLDRRRAAAAYGGVGQCEVRW
ncbi:hypothetical protein VUR80DRAFT_1180 [Thermomyces stellatus]